MDYITDLHFALSIWRKAPFPSLEMDKQTTKASKLEKDGALAMYSLDILKLCLQHFCISIFPRTLCACVDPSQPGRTEDVKSLLRLCTPLRKCPTCAELSPQTSVFSNRNVTLMWTQAISSTPQQKIWNCSSTNILRSTRTMHIYTNSWAPLTSLLHYFTSLLICRIPIWVWQWTLNFELWTTSCTAGYIIYR